MNLDFRNRIAFNYMIASSIIMAVAFVLVYIIVKSTVYINLDQDLSFEANKHTTEISIHGDSIAFINEAEWEEREHREVQVNPVFIQLMDRHGKVTGKSPNLKENALPFNRGKTGGHFDAQLEGKSIRQLELLVEEEGEIKGYILAAMSSEAARQLVLRLRNILIMSYLGILVLLYVVSRWLAGRSIQPIREMIGTISRITQKNLQERVSLPPHRDELHELSSRFNGLLGRIERAMEHERQFTADASHELRTPLASIRGTLEVLIRKPRSTDEYQEKISYCLDEIDRLSEKVDQLLLLARLESKAENQQKTPAPLRAVIVETLDRYNGLITDKNLSLEMNSVAEGEVPAYCASLILDNIVSNAVKYSPRHGKLFVETRLEDERLLCIVEDQGCGISEADLPRIYDNFFRSGTQKHKAVPGNGLGLSIAKKAADAINAEIRISSREGEGTRVELLF